MSMSSRQEQGPAGDDEVNGERQAFTNDEEGGGSLNDLEAPLLEARSETGAGGQSLSNNDEFDEEADPHSTKQCCGRLVLGTLYISISVYMILMLLTGNVMDVNFGPPRSLFRDPSLCVLFVSWGLMAISMGVSGLRYVFVPKHRDIMVFLGPLTSLILYLVLSWFYLWVRNLIKYGGNSSDDDDITDDGI